ncbi:MAG: tRNA lysidine(34) synthetase TilS [Azoarcus sp.]|jgi:tRNA(Ile)-lysidine synthase|nr:tRNA lysidine(34) synthetase TilS [Azoarcus sp.]
MRAKATEAVLAAAAKVLAGAALDERHRLCCALSGGVDSVVLLDALDHLRSRFGFALEAAHVHHGLSPAADGWQAFCEAFCRRRAIPLHVFRVDVPSGRPDGPEAAARAARHAALSRVGCDWLVLGHHRDDQAETVLFRLLRGAGVRGAAAMGAIEPADVPGQAGRLRPLLDIGRETILACAHERGLAWVDDASNADPRFARNDLRHRILPAIEAGFPAARATLARAAAHFRAAAELLDELAVADAAACGGGSGAFARQALLALGPARLANLLRQELRRLGSLPPTTARLDEAIRQLRAVKGPLRLPLGDFACHAYRGRVWLAPTRAIAQQTVSWRPAAGDIAWADGTLRCASATGNGVLASALAQASQCLLMPRPVGPQRLRLADRPAKSFRKLCQEAGIPAWLRGRLPVLEVDGRVAWIGGLGVAADFACAPGQAGWLLAWSPGFTPSEPTGNEPAPPRSEPSSC